MHRTILKVAALALAAAAPALPADLAAWTTPQPRIAALGPDMRFVLKPGTAVRLKLAPLAQVRLAATPGRAAEPGSFAGLAALDIAKPGKLRVALSDRAYVDLVRDGRALVSTTHGHGPKGSTIRKIVTFDVERGRYIVQLTGASAAEVTILPVYG